MQIPPPNSINYTSGMGPPSSGSSGSSNETTKGRLDEVTTQEEHHTTIERVTNGIDLTAQRLKDIGLGSQVALLQRGVPRLRVVRNGEDLGSGSGVFISADGLILSVNHVPALGNKSGVNPFVDLIPGSNVLKNLKTWSELLGDKGDVQFLADIPLLPQNETLGEDLASGEALNGIISELNSTFSRYQSVGATAYSRHDNDTIEVLTVPLRIIAESADEDLMLAVVDLPNKQDPFSFIPITDSIGEREHVYSIGHPKGIRHNALALGEVLDPNFDVTKVRRAAEAHSVILSGISNIFGGGQGEKPGNILSQVAKGLSVGLAGVNVEPLVKFLNGAVVSTNTIAPGSSGGLLCNRSGEAVGITYLGLLLPFQNTALLRYAAGTLGLTARELPLRSVTGSIGMKKAIPFLESHGVNIARIRDGEPSGIEVVEQEVKRQKARGAMKAFLIGEGVPDNQLEHVLNQLKLGEEPAKHNQATTETNSFTQVPADTGENPNDETVTGTFLEHIGACCDQIFDQATGQSSSAEAEILDQINPCQ